MRRPKSPHCGLTTGPPSSPTCKVGTHSSKGQTEEENEMKGKEEDLEQSSISAMLN